MDLSPEDSLRLNVLLANRPLAIRIDENRMVVQGLTEQGERSVGLNPNGHTDRYLRLVRELISGHVLGSPGGYPVYLRRWTRMGQMREKSLEQLLLLGEPEAVVAAVSSPGLSEELARRAWWAMEDADNARRMLGNPAVVRGAMGKVLAGYLIEHLAFETEHEAVMETVRLILQPDLLDSTQRLDLWRKAARKPSYLVGFLRALPDDLPELGEPRAPDVALDEMARAGNACAALLVRVQGAAGQSFLKTASTVLAKPPSQEVVLATFDVVRAYFAPMRPEGDPDLALDALLADAEGFLTAPDLDPMIAELAARCPQRSAELVAMRFLSGIGYGLIRPLLQDPTTLGSLMRRKLAPVMDSIQLQMDRLIRSVRGD